MKLLYFIHYLYKSLIYYYLSYETDTLEILEKPVHIVIKNVDIYITFYFMKKKDSKRGCDTTMPESIHTKDESKRICIHLWCSIINVTE